MTTRVKRGPGRPRKTDGGSAQAIKTSAVHVFADKGFDSANLREIAAHAGVDMALISYRFGSKLDLWKSIVADVGDRIRSSLAAATLAEHDDVEAALRESMAAFIDFVCAHPITARFLLRDVGHAPDRAQWVYDQVTAPLLAYYLPLMERAKAEGRLRAEYPELAFLNFAYGASVSTLRRGLIAGLVPQIAGDEAFRAALRDTLIEPLFRHG